MSASKSEQKCWFGKKCRAYGKTSNSGRGSGPNAKTKLHRRERRKARKDLECFAGYREFQGWDV